MKQFRNILSLALLLVGVQAFSQSQIPIGSWRVHLPSVNAFAIAENPEGIYAANSALLLYHHRETGELEAYSRTNGLSDQGLSDIDYSDSLKMLVIGYLNGNVDLMLERENGKPQIVNINDLKVKSMTGRKEIHCIRIMGNTAWLGTSFGIVELDLSRREFKNTYYIGPNAGKVNVWELEVARDSLFAATDIGVLSASLRTQNLSDFNAWKKITVLSQQARKTLAHWNNQIITTQNDSLLLYQTDGSLVIQKTISGLPFLSLRNCHGKLTLSNITRGMVLDSSLQNPFQSPYMDSIFSCSDALMDRFGRLWVADGKKGLFGYNGRSVEYIKKNGPNTPSVFSLYSDQNSVWACAGGITDAWDNTYNADGLFCFRDGNWINYNRENTKAMDGSWDILSAYSPGDGTTMVASWGWGIHVFGPEGYRQRIDPKNSILEYQTGSVDPQTGIGLCRIGGISSDSKGNLYVINYTTDKPLAVRTKSGQWAKFRTGGYNEFIGMTIDQYDQKWLINRLGNMVVVNANNTDFRLVTNQPGQGGLQDPNVNCMVMDKEGAIWVGTNKGPTAFYSPGNVFKNYNYDARQVKIQQGLFVGYLLGNEVVNCIAIDGANRKWFGTQNGAWLISADGQTQIQYFNTSNSPLLSNAVNSIAVHPITGEVFFGTDKGIISWRGNATEGSETFGEVLAFPNPVRPEYEGEIAIKGLYSNCFVKITDVNGNLVYQTKANGSTAVWNGKDPAGNKVGSGVYLVFAISDTGEETFATKVLVVR